MTNTDEKKQQSLTRRDFLKRSAGATAGLSVSSGLREPARASTSQSEKSDPLYEAFKNPPSTARPPIYWYWFDHGLNDAEIKRELNVLKAAGMGGVGIYPQSISAVPLNDKSSLGPEIEWLSTEWNRLFKLTLDEAGRLDLYVDVLANFGWNFGARDLPPQQTLQHIRTDVVAVEGHGYTGPLPVKLDANRKLVQLRLYPRVFQTAADYIDLMDKIDPDGTVHYTLPNGGLAWPSFEYLLYAVTLETRIKQVTEGGGAYVLDYMNSQAVAEHFQRISEKLPPALGGTLQRIRAIMGDNIELLDMNWTGDMSEQFQRRRGYRLEDYLPLAQMELYEATARLGDTLSRVRYDWHKTISELVLERYFHAFTDWCHANGTLSTMKATGFPNFYADLLDGFMASDIPEGDSWLYWREQLAVWDLEEVRYATFAKYASCAGHLKGRRTITAETVTDVFGEFEATLSYIKQGIDLTYLSGITNPRLDGFNYCPAGTPFPGWVFSGSGFFSEMNPFWPYMRNLTDYMARLNAIFTNTRPRAQVAILGPTPDTWSLPEGMNRTLFQRIPWYLQVLWQALHQSGFSADYVNANVLTGDAYGDGKIHYGPMEYEVLVVVEATALEPETARALQQYAEQGGRIIFIGHTPRRSAGLQNREQNDLGVRSAIQSTLAYNERVRVVEPPSSGGNVLAWLQPLLPTLGIQPPVSISPVDSRLFQVQYQDEDREIFFFTNVDRVRDIEFTARFTSVNKTPWRWDPESGKRAVLHYDELKDGLRLRLTPQESLVLVLDREADGPHAQLSPLPDLEDVFEIRTPWTVQFRPVVGVPFQRNLPSLIDVAKQPELESFSGTIVYTTKFEIQHVDRPLLDLGVVRETSEVRLNGKPLGVRWWGRHEYDASTALRKGLNVLEVKVTTTVFNYCRTQTQIRACALYTEMADDKKPLASGLIGPVRFARALRRT